MSEKEKKVFDQELSTEELDAVAGGSSPNYQTENCTYDHERDIYGGKGFPNCAATVEDGSWCKNNDACVTSAVVYGRLTDCSKAWK